MVISRSERSPREKVSVFINFSVSSTVSRRLKKSSCRTTHRLHNARLDSDSLQNATLPLVLISIRQQKFVA